MPDNLSIVQYLVDLVGTDLVIARRVDGCNADGWVKKAFDCSVATASKKRGAGLSRHAPHHAMHHNASCSMR